MTLDTAANTGITLSGSTLGTGVGVTAGSDGDNTGTNFIYWSGSSRMTNVQLATNVKAAINRSGNGSSVGVSADASTTASNAIVTATTLGSDSTFTVGGTAAGITWPGVTAGTNGTNACPLLSTATFATSSDTSTLALNLKTAINACSGANVTASNSTNTVTVTAVTPGIGANSTVTTPTTVNATGFNWEGGTLTGGSDGDNTGTNFRYWSVSARVSNVVLAGYVATAINAGGNGSSVGVSASAVSTNVLTVTATASGYAGNSITLGGSASGFTWANPTLFGGTIAGTCTGPAVTWSYDTHTGAGGPVTTSPVLSLDGTKVAFVESLSTGSVLHILRPKTDAINGIGTEGTVGVPVVPSTVTSDGTTFNNCVATSASCMFNLTYTTAANTNSSPYYVYFDDILYLGDDNGKLVKITGVFNGTPAVAWTATVNSTAGTKVTSPVVDYSTGTIFVGDSTGKISSVTSSGTATGI